MKGTWSRPPNDTTTHFSPHSSAASRNLSGFSTAQWQLRYFQMYSIYVCMYRVGTADIHNLHWKCKAENALACEPELSANGRSVGRSFHDFPLLPSVAPYLQDLCFYFTFILYCCFLVIFCHTCFMFYVAVAKSTASTLKSKLTTLGDHSFSIERRHLFANVHINICMFVCKATC